MLLLIFTGCDSSIFSRSSKSIKSQGDLTLTISPAPDSPADRWVSGDATSVMAFGVDLTLSANEEITLRHVMPWLDEMKAGAYNDTGITSVSLYANLHGRDFTDEDTQLVATRDWTGARAPYTNVSLPFCRGFPPSRRIRLYFVIDGFDVSALYHGKTFTFRLGIHDLVLQPHVQVVGEAVSGTISIDTHPPVIAVYSPHADRAPVTVSTYKVAGQILDPDGGQIATADVTIGSSVTQLTLTADGTFSQNIQLPSLSQGVLYSTVSLVFHAVDQNGASASLTRSVDLFAPYVPNEVLVKFKPGVSSQRISQINGAVGASVVQNFDHIGVYHIRMPPALSVPQAIIYYEGTNSSEVQFAHENKIAFLQQASGDEFLAQQKALQYINAPSAWGIQTGDRRVIVAVMDSGIDVSHPDLYENIWINQKEVPQRYKANGDRNLDLDGDGLITFAELNNSGNIARIASWDPAWDKNSNGYFDAEDMVSGYLRYPTSSIFENGVDEGFDNNGYADDLVGYNFSSQSYYGPVGSGSAWLPDGPAFTPVRNPGTTHINSIHGPAGSDFGVWAVGGFGGKGEVLYRSWGGPWTTVFSCNAELRDVFAVSPTDVYTVGDQGNIWHYDGNAWSQMSSGTTRDLYAVCATTATDVVAVGYYGTILMYNGTTWNAVMMPGPQQHLRDVGISPAGGPVYAVGSGGTIIESWNRGAAWSVVVNPAWTIQDPRVPPPTNTVWLNSIVFEGNRTHFLGDYGTILYRLENATGRPFTVVSTGAMPGAPTAETIRGAWGRYWSGGRVFTMYAVGDNGALLKYENRFPLWTPVWTVEQTTAGNTYLSTPWYRCVWGDFVTLNLIHAVLIGGNLINQNFSLPPFQPQYTLNPTLLEAKLAPNNLPYDPYGHGTMVAGIIGAKGTAPPTQTGTGIAGVCWNVSLMPLRCTMGNGSAVSETDAIGALRYAVRNGASIVNMSFANYLYPSTYSPNTLQTLQLAFANAEQNNVLIVASAGNGDQPRALSQVDVDNYFPMWPGGLPNANIICATGFDYRANQGTGALTDLLNPTISGNVPWLAGTPWSGLCANFGASSVDIGAPGNPDSSQNPLTGGALSALGPLTDVLTTHPTYSYGILQNNPYAVYGSTSWPPSPIYTFQLSRPNLTLANPPKYENGYGYFAGSSASAAYVSGVAALVAAQRLARGSPPNAIAIRDAILESAIWKQSLAGKCTTSGVLDARAALEWLDRKCLVTGVENDRGWISSWDLSSWGTANWQYPKIFGDFRPFYGNQSYNAGHSTACADFDKDGVDELVIAAGCNAEPLVEVYRVTYGGSLQLVYSFFAFTYDPNSCGVNVAYGDINGDGTPELLTAPRGDSGWASYQPSVTAWNVSYNAGNNTWSHQYFDQVQPFGSGHSWGIEIACGNLDKTSPDPRDELVASTGSPPQVPFTLPQEVRIFRRSPILGWQFLCRSTAFPAMRGLRVGTGDVDGDGNQEVLCVSGPGLTPPNLWIWKLDVSQSPPVLAIRHQQGGWTGRDYGMFICGGRVWGSGKDQIIIGSGSGYGPVAWVYEEDSSGALQYATQIVTRENSFKGGVTLSTGRFR